MSPASLQEPGDGAGLAGEPSTDWLGIESAASSHRNSPTRILRKRPKAEAGSRDCTEPWLPAARTPRTSHRNCCGAWPRHGPASPVAAEVSRGEAEALSISGSPSGARGSKYETQSRFKHTRPQAALRNQLKSCQVIKTEGWKRFFRASSCCQRFQSQSAPRSGGRAGAPASLQAAGGAL